MPEAIPIKHVNVLMVLLVKIRKVDARSLVRDVRADFVSELPKFRRELWWGFLWIVTYMVFPCGSRTVEYCLSSPSENPLYMPLDIAAGDLAFNSSVLPRSLWTAPNMNS